MIALLRAELLKLRTTRTFVALTGSALALSLLVAVLTTTLSELGEQDVRELFAGDFTGLFILLLGVMGMAGEWRHKTIRSTVLAAPVRARLVAAKVSFVLEPAILSLEPDVGRFGPTSGAPAGIQALDAFGGDLLAPGIALLVMIGWVALGSVAAAAVVRRRDLV